MGITDEQTTHLVDPELPAGMFTPDEEAIIYYAQASAMMQPITDEIWHALEQHFDAQQLIELCFMVGMSQTASRFHATFHTNVDDTVTAAVGNACAVPMPAAPPASLTGAAGSAS